MGEIWSQYSDKSILEQLNVFREFCYLTCTKTGFSLSLNSGTSSLFAELPSSKASNIKRNAVLHENWQPAAAPSCYCDNTLIKNKTSVLCLKSNGKTPQHNPLASSILLYSIPFSDRTWTPMYIKNIPTPKKLTPSTLPNLKRGESTLVWLASLKSLKSPGNVSKIIKSSRLLHKALIKGILDILRPLCC